jgi:hypothetical protein
MEIGGILSPMYLPFSWDRGTKQGGFYDYIDEESKVFQE